MAPRTFGATKFRNAVPAIPTRDEWYRTHLSPASSAPPNTSTYSGLVKTTREAVIILAPNGDASVRPYSAIGEHEGEVWTGKIGPVADWDVSRLEDAGMLVAGNDGTATYYSITDKLEARHSFGLGGKASCVRLHPTTPGLALASTNVVVIYDVAASTAAITLNAPAPLWSASWSPDGRLVGGVSKKGLAYVWDVRSGSAPTQTRDLSSLLQALKPVHTAYVGNELFVTSFSRSRTRQYSLLSADLSTAFTAAVDTSQGPLVPLVDEERRIVYASGRGDMTLRQIELSGPQGYQEMPHHLPAPLTAGGAAAAHWSTLPVMEAQIATLLLSTTDKDGDTILPLGIKVPRRQLIDYHTDLFPDVAGSVPEQDAAQWLAGGDKAPIHASVDPERRAAWEKTMDEGKAKWATAAAVAAAPAATPTPTSAPAPEPAAAPRAPSPAKPSALAVAAPAPTARSVSPPKSTQAAKHTSPEPGLPPLKGDEDDTSTSLPVQQEKPTPTTSAPMPAPVARTAASLAVTASSPTASAYATAQSSPKPPSPESQKAPSAAPKAPSSPPKAPSPKPVPAAKSASPPAPATQPAAHKPYNPGWSRKYLAGKTPLIPTYDQIPTLATLHQDSQILRVSPNLAFFPVQGPGGRLLVHPLSKKGRLPVGGVGFVTGGVALAAFAADPFSDRVVCAGEDGVLRTWELPSDGVEGAGPEPTLVRGVGVERIAHVAFHPTARDLLLVESNEHGSSHLRFFDLSSGKEGKVVSLPAPVTGFAISDCGQRVALPTKDGRILVRDRDGKFVEGKAHDSPRAAQVAWAGDHLVSFGFGRGSIRQLHVYSVREKVERIAALSLDVSPSVLFPQNILAFLINPLGEVIDKLPSFTAGSPQLGVAFFPKSSLDITKVEVAKCLRLTSRSVEQVTFSVPRNRPQFFQDDIYVPTRDTKPTISAAEWLAGAPGLPKYISLRPAGMELLSEAPAQNTVRRKFVPAAAIMSEEQRKQKAMDDLFAKAKDDSDSDDEPQRRGGIPPPDDDW
ncbi:hypothetical protein CspHIS471_0501630 [Cutaneotrichosporon sp. HIS471]|nr:hypothetical protein CspHIS471_0501630 [Cutaneotrichosporon sp. HIS471]